MSSRKDRWNKIDEKSIENKTWYIFKWEIIVIIGAALLAALLNEIPNWYVKPLEDGTIDPIHSYPLINNIYYNTISIIITVGISIFIGVFTEIGKFAGKYGSTLFVLVPSIIWLLSDRSDNRVEHIVETSADLGEGIFWGIIAVAIVFGILVIVRHVLRNQMVSVRDKIRMEFIINYINRFLLIIVNILIVLMLGYSLINYGILSLHLADITPEMKKMDSSLKNMTHNLHSESFTTYIAIVATIFALLMVLIGLSTTFTSNSVSTNAQTIYVDLSDNNKFDAEAMALENEENQEVINTGELRVDSEIFEEQSKIRQEKKEKEKTEYKRAVKEDLMVEEKEEHDDVFDLKEEDDEENN